MYVIDNANGILINKLDLALKRPNSITSWNNYVFIIDRDDSNLIIYNFINN